MAKLVVRTGQLKGYEFALKGDRMVIGRRSANAVHLPDAKASREHAVLFFKGETLYVQDLSRNGTLLNDQPATKAADGQKVNVGDKIKIGETVLELIDEKSEPIALDIPGYDIVERVGSGGMGTVYKARQLSMDRIVALKILNERYSTNAEFVDRFIREARAAGKLNHPNVIHVHDISKVNGRHFFSMEFIDGPTVKDMLRKETRIEINRALDIVRQVAQALEFAHSNKIVHRDIKPDNLMLTKEGIVKIADLGIAKTFEENSAAAKERRVMGTPHYMAPEQALGKAIDHRVDIYSLGATFYHMVTGTTPFSGASSNEILKAHVQASLPAVQDLNKDVPDPVCFIIERMMAKLPEKRYMNMSRLIEDIEKIQSGAVKGITRIDAADSSIQRALAKSEQKDKPVKPRVRVESPTSEIATGVQSPVSRAALALAMVAVFVLVVAAVIYISKQVNQSANGQPEARAGGSGTSPAQDRQSNPVAKKQLELAKASEKSNPAEFERLLNELVTRYPTTIDAEEGRRLLEDFRSKRREGERTKVEALLAEARALGTDPARSREALKKFEEAAAAAANNPELKAEASSQADKLRTKVSDEASQAAAADYRAAMDKFSSAKTNFDFDSARKALQTFSDAHPNAPQKAGMDDAMNKLNAEAQAAFKRVKEITDPMEVSAAINEWNKFQAQVKDSTLAEQIAAARQAIEGKADNAAQEELVKASERARKNDYAGALTLVQGLQKKLGGTKWAVLAKAKEDSIKKQEALFNIVLATANSRVAKAPLEIPKKIVVDKRFGDIRWNLTKVSGDQFSFDAEPKNKAPGFMKRLGEFPPEDQYQLYLLLLPAPKDISQEMHRQLAAFCMERGLGQEAEYHDKNSGQ